MTIKWFSILIFSIVLLPITIENSDGVGISSNYLFAILMPILMGFKFKKNNDAIINIIYLIVAYLVGVILNIFYYKFGQKEVFSQTLSLIVSMLPLVIVFFDVGKQEENFKNAVILCASIYGSIALYFFIYAWNSGIKNPFEIKEYLGLHLPDWPQRYILVVFAGFYFSLSETHKGFFQKIISLLLLVVIILTYLRAAYLALAISAIFFYIYKYRIDKINKNYDINYLKSILFIIFTFLFIFLFFEDSIVNIFEYIMSTVYSQLGTGDMPASDSTRMSIWSSAMNILKINPITGNGGGGIYLYDNDFGSYHNQFIDVLTRFGLIGLMIFLYYNYRIFNILKQSPSIIAVAIAYLIFGVAHETIKFSYGAVIFYFILALTYSKKYKK